MVHGGVAILDFGSQYNQLIARRVREMGVYCELIPGNAPFSRVMKMHPEALILSGGPSSVYDDDSPHPDPELFRTALPVLGICYGMQLLALHENGRVEGGHDREYGPAKLYPEKGTALFEGIGDGLQAWMSHGDRVVEVPERYRIAAHTDTLPIAAMEDTERQRFGVQFHPEVNHTEFGEQLLDNFVFHIAKLSRNWDMKTFRKSAVEMIRHELPDGGKVILGLSGGVDSSVVAALLHEAIPDRFIPIFVDNGLLRKGERESVVKTFRDHFGMPLMVIDGRDDFLRALEGVTDPEKKRKIIGRVFIELFEEASSEIEGVTHLAQGTLYPDVIESISFRGPSATIKSHHNVGGLPERMNLKLLEPLRELFKDEVRSLGRELGLPELMVARHPFPGPGLAVRILGDVNSEDLDILKEADWIFIDYLLNNDLYNEIWQAFAVLLPVRTVGVMGDQRTYDRVIALRAVTSTDGMTADWYRMAPEHMARISSEIVNRVRGVSRIVYDISSKPPGTIEWE
ncbi:MAG: glutamine-hydrolyzing GMP synthase [Candidatus Aegiribacteria sp.]|nr:glutamine-hydrolyzing GMP synthase [Candidatus Aegiribacteria sp.]